MKIGITCYPTYGGSGVVATELGKRLVDYDIEVHFISYALPYRLNIVTPNIFFHEVEVLNYPLFEYPPYSLSLASKMVEVIEYHQLDLLHVHYAIPHATSAYLARQMLNENPIGIITTLHGTDITLLGKDPSFYKITEFSIRNSTGITAVSEYLKKRTNEVFNVPNQIEVISNFIPFDRAEINPKDHTLRKQFATEDEIIITHISNFRPPKRVEDIAHILKELPSRDRVKILMVGDGPERYKVEELCRKERLCDRIVFLGKQENIQQLLSITDIFLLPSETESFGLAALEAMAYAVPCITSNAGGLPEVNIHGESGFTIEVGAIKEYVEVLERLINDRRKLEKMGKNAQEIAYSKFSAEIIIPRYIAYYEKILNE
jgi:N-acetyl-alpha-D-glucosaminyl L-malate synthase BshA